MGSQRFRHDWATELNWWLSWWRSSKESTCSVEDPLDGKIPWRREWQSSPLFWSGKSYEQRSLQAYSPWGRRVEHNWATDQGETSMQLNSILKKNVTEKNATQSHIPIYTRHTPWHYTSMATKWVTLNVKIRGLGSPPECFLLPVITTPEKHFSLLLAVHLRRPTWACHSACPAVTLWFLPQ